MRGVGEDRLVRVSLRKWGFVVKSYYRVLSSREGDLFLWKGIWKARVPPRVAFFMWTTTLGKILTGDNLRKRRMVLMDWCCMCKASRETMDLLLHCSVASKLWSLVFCLFGIQWTALDG